MKSQPRKQFSSLTTKCLANKKSRCFLTRSVGKNDKIFRFTQEDFLTEIGQEVHKVLTNVSTAVEEVTGKINCNIIGLLIASKHHGKESATAVEEKDMRSETAGLQDHYLVLEEMTTEEAGPEAMEDLIATTIVEEDILHAPIPQ